MLQILKAGPAPGYHERTRALTALRQAIRAHIPAIIQAVSDDFGGRSVDETLMFEVFPLLAQIRHTRRCLKRWMKPQSVSSAWYLLPAGAYYEYQPLGVVGIVGTWNFPFLLTLSPLIDALAAGNCVMLKPSEVTPKSAALIASLIAGCFPAHHVTCINGDAETAQAFTRLPFDHLLLTGSPALGRQVMASAAANLTPVTLELGGKSPAIVHESYNIARATNRILTAKLFNAGQTCLAPDYVLVHETQAAAFEAEAWRVVARLYPALPDTPDYSSIVNPHHRSRLTRLVDDARQKGARVIELAPVSIRAFPPTLVFNATPDMLLLQEEIFGPILPVLTYRSVSEALSFIIQRPAPLALYYFDDNSARCRQVIQNTRSGGVTINDCIYHFGQPNLPFGGVGASGMGQYHGFHGFVTFSKKRAVMVQRRFAATTLLRAPFQDFNQTLIKLLIKVAG